jgi:hypothetical protein
VTVTHHIAGNSRSNYQANKLIQPANGVGTSGDAFCVPTTP